MLDLNGFNQTVGSLSSSSSQSGITLGSGTLSVNQSVTTTFAGSISGTGGLTKLGIGTLILSGNNTYSGATTITAGTLQVSGGSAIGDLSNVTLANASGARLNLNGSSETIGWKASHKESSARSKSSRRSRSDIVFHDSGAPAGRPRGAEIGRVRNSVLVT